MGFDSRKGRLKGYGLLYLHLYEINPDKGDHSYLHKALDFIKGPIDNLKEQKAGFLCGDSGPYALAVVIYSLLGDAQNSQKYLKKRGINFLMAEWDFQLYSLLFIQRKLGEDTIRKDLILKIVDITLDSGNLLAEEQKWKHPLMFFTHEIYDLGAKHGMAGILYMLLTLFSILKRCSH